MSRLSQTFLPTLKDAPADAEALSHKLAVRAGLIRQLGAGLWTFLPAGWRVMRKIEAVLREEMDAIGCQEVFMPVLQPAEIWKETGRYAIEELFKLEDRKGSPMVLALTHEECLTYHVAREVRSYRDLPLTLYHLQTKERDEARPRAGLLRTREFVMKDAYSFDRDEEGLARSYELQAGAYARILDRCGLRWYRVESDVGMMGGTGAHEYMAPCPAGENEVALAPGYAANIEVASAAPQAVEPPPPLEAPELVSTPGLTTVEEVSGALGVAPGEVTLLGCASWASVAPSLFPGCRFRAIDEHREGAHIRRRRGRYGILGTHDDFAVLSMGGNLISAPGVSERKSSSPLAAATSR